MNKKKLIIIIVLLLVVIASGTYSWSRWGTKKTSMVLTVGDISDIQVILTPYKFTGTLDPAMTYTNEDYIKVTATNNKNKIGNIVLAYNINNIDKELISEDLKYMITKSDTVDGTFEEYESGNFADALSGQSLYILDEQLEAKSTTYYRVYIWLDSSNKDQTNMQDKSLEIELIAEITDLRTLQNGDTPTLDDGMIPIVIDNSGSSTIVKTIFSTDEKWYNYPNKEWANAIVVKSSKRSKYLNTTGTIVNQNDILAYYVWIPRFKYYISNTDNASTINIRFETKDSFASNGDGITTYTTHSAFNYEDNNLDGFWIGKFETSKGLISTVGTDNPVILPNVPSWTGQNISAQYETAKMFSASENPYGLTNVSNSHLIKNSEWGAVAYLSHSIYGINKEIYINNSSHTITGRSGGNTGGNVNDLISQYPDATESNTSYPYGYYTWDGKIISYGGAIGGYANDKTLGTNASTTGNITGVYDMSGGASEYVMGVLAKEMTIRSGYTSTDNSGFTGLLGDNTNYSGINLSNNDSYNIYTTESSSDACSKNICYGEALSETNGWYSDSSTFVKNNYPWLTRGGAYNDGTSAGIFNFYPKTGAANDKTSFRNVLAILK